MTPAIDHQSGSSIAGHHAPTPHREWRYRVTLLGVVAVTTIVAAQIVSRGIADLAATTQPEAVISLRGDHAPALLRLAEKQLALSEAGTHSDVDEAVKAHAEAAWATATRALKVEPVSARTLGLLGKAAHQRGNEPLAHRLMIAAVRRSIRETRANVWLANYELRRGDYGKALTRIDALVRTDPTSRKTVFPVLLAMAETPEALEKLVAVLGNKPPWRAWFLGMIPGRATQLTSLSGLYLRLISTPEPITPAELKPYLDRLVAQNAIEQAYYLWIKFLPEDTLARLGYLYNGSFDLQHTNLPFDWVIHPIQGATIQFAPLPEGNGQRALLVEFAQKRVPFRHVTQMTLLPPGRYRFAGRYRASELNNRRGMSWRIYCAEKPGGLVAETERVSGTTANWREFEIAFEIPKTGCRAQWFRLELAARINAEQEVSGSIWYDDLEIIRVDPSVSGSATKNTNTTIVPPSSGALFERAIRRQ